MLCHVHCLTRVCCLNCLSIEWNSIRLGGSAHGIVTKTVCKTLPGGGGGLGGAGGQGGGGVIHGVGFLSVIR